MKDRVHISNRKASFDYFFIRELVAGIQLQGTEVKQIRRGKISLADSFCSFENGDLYMRGTNIPVSEDAFTHDPERPRKLLLNRNELDKLSRDLNEGMTIVVKRIYSNDRNLIKAEIALARGKKNFDKRESIKDRETKREIQRETGKH